MINPPGGIVPSNANQTLYFSDKTLSQQIALHEKRQSRSHRKSMRKVVAVSHPGGF
jgi:hypothetical protein